MNKVHGKTIFTQNKLSIQKTRNLFFCKESVASFPARHKGKKLLFPNLCGQLLQNFCTCSPSSLGQDLMVENAIFILFFHLDFLS
jgi:hypothetical protein